MLKRSNHNPKRARNKGNECCASTPQLLSDYCLTIWGPFWTLFGRSPRVRTFTKTTPLETQLEHFLSALAVHGKSPLKRVLERVRRCSKRPSIHGSGTCKDTRGPRSPETATTALSRASAKTVEHACFGDGVSSSRRCARYLLGKPSVGGVFLKARTSSPSQTRPKRGMSNRRCSRSTIRPLSDPVLTSSRRCRRSCSVDVWTKISRKGPPQRSRVLSE